MTQIRNYLDYDISRKNVEEIKILMNQWINLIKSTIDNDRQFTLVLFGLNRFDIEKLEPFFDREFISSLKKTQDSLHQGIFKESHFTLFSPQTYGGLRSFGKSSCIVFFLKEEDLLPLSDLSNFDIEHLLLIPCPNMGKYLTFQKASKQFCNEKELSPSVPDFILDSTFNNEFHKIIESTPATNESLNQDICHPTDVVKLRQGLRKLKLKKGIIIPQKNELIGYLLYEYANSTNGNKGCTFLNVKFIVKYLYD